VTGVCVNGKTGEKLFDIAIEAGGANQVCPQVRGDYYVGIGQYLADEFTLFRCTPKGLVTIGAIPNDRYAAPCMNDTHLYLSTSSGLRAYELATGKLTAKVPQGVGCRTHHSFIGGDRLFINTEGRHGTPHFLMFDLTDPGQPKPLGTVAGATDFAPQAINQLAWNPPHLTTTAYASHSLGYPVVDGRIFIRGANGIYCYDLRKE